MSNGVAPVVDLLFVMAAISGLSGIFIKELRAGFLCAALGIVLLASVLVVSTGPAAMPYPVLVSLAIAANLSLVLAFILIRNPLLAQSRQ